MREAPARMHATRSPTAEVGGDRGSVDTLATLDGTPGGPLSLVVLVPALAVVLVVSIGVAVSTGAVGVGLATVARVAGHHLTGFAVPADFSALQDQIVWQLRMPRVLLAAVVGAGLSVVGTTLQAVVRNPLADPYVLGVSAGAGLLAAATITLGAAAVAGLSTTAAGFVGALVTTALVLGVSRGGGRFAPTRVVLAGVTFSYLFSGATNFLIFQSRDPNAAGSVLFWLLGSLGRADWSSLGLPAAAVLLGTAYLMVQARPLNAVVVGEETALSVGINVRRLRARLLVVTALLTGVMVAVSGGIGFVGLIIPHIVRLVVGSDHRRVLPLGALVGAIYLVAVDTLCRVVVSPTELPIGIVTAVIGAPYFLWLLRRARSGAMAR